MLHAALIALVLGLVVWGLNWTGLAEMPTQVYWVFTVGGMLLMLRKSDSTIPTRRAASLGFIVEGATQAVQLARRAPL